jgi:hypothetical protein
MENWDLSFIGNTDLRWEENDIRKIETPDVMDNGYGINNLLIYKWIATDMQSPLNWALMI